MTQLKVIVKKLNRRSAPPAAFSDKNITGTIVEGTLFEGEEVTVVPNPSLGKWYKSTGGYYWGGGLIDLGIPLGETVQKAALLQLQEPYIKGIDVSHHNTIADWKEIAAQGIRFTYIKLSEGVGTPDNKAKEHALSANAAGLKIGYYHFCRPDMRNGGTVENDAQAEAGEVKRLLGGVLPPDLPIVLDLEDQLSWDSNLSKDDYEKWIRFFIAEIQTDSVYDVMLYSRKEYLDRHLNSSHALGQYKLWLSRYQQPSMIEKLQCPAGWTDWAVWQYTETGSVGTNTHIDINILKSAIFPNV